MKLYSYSGRWKKDAQGSYTPWGSPPPGGQWANPGAIDAYGKWYTQYKKGKSTTPFVSYDNFAQNYKGGGNNANPGGGFRPGGGFNSSLGQQSSVPQAPSMMGQQSTFSQQPQNKQNPQMQGYIQQIQQQIQQLQQQLKQMQQGY